MKFSVILIYLILSTNPLPSHKIAPWMLSSCQRIAPSQESNDAMREEDLIMLPHVQSSKAIFPPSSRVWIVSKPAKNDCFAVSEGTVSAVFVGDIFAASRCIYYRVKDKCMNTKIVAEGYLVFGRNVPVHFFDDASAGAQNGEVLSCTLGSSLHGEANSRVNYTVLIFGRDSDSHFIKHGVRQQQLRYRLGNVTTSNPGLINEVDQQITAMCQSEPSKPPPGFIDTTQSATNLCTSLPKQKEIGIPNWLVSIETDCELVKSEFDRC